MNGLCQDISTVNVEQFIWRFPNGYGASVVRHSLSYGNQNGEGFWEIAVLSLDNPDSPDTSLCYSTPITDDVLGWLDEPAVDATLESIASLPAREGWAL